MTIDERGTSIHLTNKKGECWHLLQYDATSPFEKMNENECKEAFEEMVFELRRLIDDRFNIIQKQ